MHLYDNRELTFAELKDVIAAAAEGRLEGVTEKLDGMNLVFTWDGTLKVARSGKDIASGGKDAAALSAQFAGHRNPRVQDAFNGAFKVLNDAVGSLSKKVIDSIFFRGRVWYSIEVIYAQNPNVINYDNDYVVFHNSPVFRVQRDHSIQKLDDAPGAAILSRYVDQMQAAVTQRSWQVRGPAVLRLKKMSDGSAVRHALESIRREQHYAGVTDADTIGDYLRNAVGDRVEELKLTPAVHDAVVSRLIKEPGAPGLPIIKKMAPERYEEIRALVEKDREVVQQAIAPIEHAIHRFAIEVMRGLHSVLVGNHDAEVARLRQHVAVAVNAIQSSGEDKAMDVLSSQMSKLGNVENIASAMEGIVFIYKGKAYKFTGAFAPMNQILGLFKHGRSGVRLGEQELREALDGLLNKAQM